MKKFFQLSANGYAFINYIGLAGVFAFLLLNLAALVEYGKYALGIPNRFISLLPAIKLLVNIDFLFILALILMYNAVEKFFSPKVLSIGILLIGMFSTIYTLVKDKPLLIIASLGLYGLGISIYASIIGFGIHIPKKSTASKVNYDEPQLSIEKEA